MFTMTIITSFQPTKGKYQLDFVQNFAAGSNPVLTYASFGDFTCGVKPTDAPTEKPATTEANTGECL